jgi:hypothetical protein
MERNRFIIDRLKKLLDPPQGQSTGVPPVTPESPSTRPQRGSRAVYGGAPYYPLPHDYSDDKPDQTPPVEQEVEVEGLPGPATVGEIIMNQDFSERPGEGPDTDVVVEGDQIDVQVEPDEIEEVADTVDSGWDDGGDDGGGDD